MMKRTNLTRKFLVFDLATWKLRMECARLSPKATGSEGGMDACGRVLGDEERAKKSGTVILDIIGSSFFNFMFLRVSFLKGFEG